jgi:hypothetical protein
VGSNAAEFNNRPQILGSKALLTAGIFLVSCLAYALAPKMDPICSPEASLSSYRTKGLCLQYDRDLRSEEFHRLHSSSDTVRVKCSGTHSKVGKGSHLPYEGVQLRIILKWNFRIRRVGTNHVGESRAHWQPIGAVIHF